MNFFALHLDVPCNCYMFLWELSNGIDRFVGISAAITSGRNP